MSKLALLGDSFNVQVLLVLDSDGETPATGLVDGDFTAKTLSKDGAAFAALSGSITEIAHGLYQVPISASEADTPGMLWLHLEAPGIMDLTAPVAQVGINTPDSIAEDLKILMGLSNGMMVIDNTVYDSNGLTSARIRVFDDEADVGAATDGGSGEGEIATIAIDSTYVAAGQIDVYRARRTS